MNKTKVNIQVDVLLLQKKTKDMINKRLFCEFQEKKLDITPECKDLICEYLLSYNAKLLSTALNLINLAKKKTLMKDELLIAKKIMSLLIKNEKLY